MSDEQTEDTQGGQVAAAVEPASAEPTVEATPTTEPTTPETPAV